MKFEELVVNYLGEFGRYQKIQFLLVCLPSMFTAMHALSWTFTAANSPHRCAVTPSEQFNSPFFLNHYDSRLYTPNRCVPTPNTLSDCHYAECTLANNVTCSRYVYDTSQISYSALMRWDIVCDRSVLKAVIQSTYYIGQMIGSLVFGYLGDRIGRKKVFITAIILQIISGFGLVVAPHWSVFGILRAGVGFAHPGIFVIAVVIGVELVGPKKRKIASVFTGIFFSLGQMVLGLLAYGIRDYQWLQLAIAAPTVIFLSYWWLVPESARWLFSQKRYEEADKILQRAARFNKTKLPDKWWEQIDDSVPTQTETKTSEPLSDAQPEAAQEIPAQAVVKKRKYGFTDLLKTKKMRKISISIFICWPIVSMVYYGVSMNTSFLGGDLYWTFIFGALMEVPSVLLVFFLVDVIGRKALLAGGFTVASLCLLSNLATDAIGGSAGKWLALVQFLLAKGSITGTYATIYTFTPELFPTVVRNTAMGVCSMMARVGAILASYIAMWLVDKFGKIAMIIPFASLGLVAAAVIIIFLPETNGKNLSETIEELEGTVQQYEMQPLTASAVEGEAEANKKD